MKNQIEIFEDIKKSDTSQIERGNFIRGRNRKVFEAYKFMIVDDHQYINNMLHNVLSQFGATNVILATSSDEAMEFLHKIVTAPYKVGVSNLDMILVDYNLTGSSQNGWELARFIRSQRQSIYEFVRIVGVTAFADAEILREARDSGINSVLSKPFSVRSIYDKILGTINDDRDFAECFNGSYFGPERFEREVSLDRKLTGEPLPGVRFVHSKRIAQKISPEIFTEFLDKELEIQEKELKEMAEKIESKGDALLLDLLSECKSFKSGINSDSRLSVLRRLGILADKIRDDAVVFNFPESIIIASYLARLSRMDEICRHRHIEKIVEGLVLLLRMIIIGNGRANKPTLNQLLEELKVLMKKITDGISQEATEEMFIDLYHHED